MATRNGNATADVLEQPVCPRCNTLVIDHFSEERDYIGCPDNAIAGAMAQAGAATAAAAPEAYEAAEAVPGIPRRTVARQAANGTRNAVTYVVAGRTKWDARKIEADEDMTPREKEMFKYVLTQQAKGGAVESQANVDLGPGGAMLKRLGITRPFSAKACESAIWGLKNKEIIVPRPVK